MRKLLAIVIFLTTCSTAAFAYNEIPSDGPIAAVHQHAKAGNPEAQFQLAEALRNGEEGVHKDMKEAMKWYHKAATQGYPEAMMALGFAYRGGDGIIMNKALSYMWFEIAYKNGNESAYSMRNDVAWSMTQSEISEGRRRAAAWKVNRDNDDGYEGEPDEDE